VLSLRKNFDYHALLGEKNPLLQFPKLKEAAIDEFSRKSFAEASLNEILKTAGMSKGSLYHHFGDKFGLYLAMLDLIVEKKLSYFYPLLQDGLDTSDFFDLLQKTMKATMDFMVADPRMHHLSNRLLEESVEFRNRLLSFYTPDYFQTFAAYVRQAVESGQIDSRYPPEFVAQVVEIMLSSVHKLVRTGEPEELLETAAQVVDFIKYGISRR
jgi:TetR/AcrR family transcriptional regulator